MVNVLDSGVLDSSQRVAGNMYIYIKRVRNGNCIYAYVIVEEYLGKGKRRTIAKFSLKKLLEQEGIEVDWCGGWDLNPRRPTPSGPEPDPFGQARAPPHPYWRGVIQNVPLGSWGILLLARGGSLLFILGVSHRGGRAPPPSGGWGMVRLG